MLDRTIEEFNQNILDLKADLPLPQEDLNTRFNEYFQYSLQSLWKSCIGNEIESFEKELNERFENEF